MKQMKWIEHIQNKHITFAQATALLGGNSLCISKFMYLCSVLRHRHIFDTQESVA